MKRLPRCEKCGKVAYPSMREAIKGAIGSSRTLGSGFRPYQAHGAWHLTTWRKGAA